LLLFLETVYLSLLEVAINAVLLELLNNPKEDKSNSKSNSTTSTKEKSSHSLKHKEAEKSNCPYTTSSSLNNEHHSEHESRKTKTLATTNSNTTSYFNQPSMATTISVAKASPSASTHAFSISKNNTLLGTKPSSKVIYHGDEEEHKRNSLNLVNKKNTSHNSHGHSHDFDHDSTFTSPVSFNHNSNHHNEINGFTKPNRNSMINHNSSILDEDDMLVEDIQLQDFDMPMNDISTNRHSYSSHGNNNGINIWKNQGKPISMETSKDLLNLVYGDTKEIYQDSWKGKNFIFNKNPNVSYGLIQEKVIKSLIYIRKNSLK